ALSSEPIPGTALDTCENSSGFRRVLARPNSAPAAPAACSGVAPNSFESCPTSSGLALAAATASAVAAGTFAASWAGEDVCAFSTGAAATRSAKHTIPKQLLRVMATSATCADFRTSSRQAAQSKLESRNRPGDVRPVTVSTQGLAAGARVTVGAGEGTPRHLVESRGL